MPYKSHNVLDHDNQLQLKHPPFNTPFNKHSTTTTLNMFKYVSAPQELPSSHWLIGTFIAAAVSCSHWLRLRRQHQQGRTDTQLPERCIRCGGQLPVCL